MPSWVPLPTSPLQTDVPHPTTLEAGARDPSTSGLHHLSGLGATWGGREKEELRGGRPLASWAQNHSPVYSLPHPSPECWGDSQEGDRG